MKYLIGFSLLLLSAMMQAQAERTVTQSFDVANASTIKIDIPDNYKIEYHASAGITVTTHVKMENSSAQTLDFAIENDRYALSLESQNDVFALKSKEPLRKSLRSKAGEIKEQVTVLFTLPQEYAPQNENNQVFVKKELQSNIAPFASLTKEDIIRHAYQSFETDHVNSIAIQVDDQCLVKTWNGNTIQVETQIKVANTTPQTLDNLIKNERYMLVADQNGAVMLVRAKNSPRKVLKTKTGEVFEEVLVKILIPEDFTPTNADMRNFVKHNARYGESN